LGIAGLRGSGQRTDLATELLGCIADEAIDAAGGYAARDVLGFRGADRRIAERQLSRLATASRIPGAARARP
jgi:hypothetical protein